MFVGDPKATQEQASQIGSLELAILWFFFCGGVDHVKLPHLQLRCG